MWSMVYLTLILRARVGYDSRGNKCQLMARSLLREVTEPAVFGFDQWVAKDTLEMFGCEK